MANVSGQFGDRIQETSTTTGTGTLVLSGTAVTGYQTFVNAGVYNGGRVTYVIVAGTEWEVGDGIWSSSVPSLTRENVYSSSNSGSLVSFSAGTKNVWVDLPAAQIASIGLSIAFLARGVPQ